MSLMDLLVNDCKFLLIPEILIVFFKHVVNLLIRNLLFCFVQYLSLRYLIFHIVFHDFVETCFTGYSRQLDKAKEICLGLPLPMCFLLFL